MSDELSSYRGIHLEPWYLSLHLHGGKVHLFKALLNNGVIAAAPEVATPGESTEAMTHIATGHIADLLHRRVCVFHSFEPGSLDVATIEACADRLRTETGLFAVYIIADREGSAEAMCLDSLAGRHGNISDAARAVWVLKALGGWDESPVMRIAVNGQVVDIHSRLNRPQDGWQLALHWP